MQRKLILFGAQLFKNTGINIFKDEDSCSIIWRFVTIFGLFALAHLSSFMVSITNTDHFYAFAIPFPYVAGATIMLTGIYLLYHQRNTIGDIFYKMDEDFYIYPDEGSIQIEYSWYLDEEIILRVLIPIATYASFSVLFVIATWILGELIYFGRMKTDVYPMWTPWKLDTLEEEFCAFVFQSLQGFCGLWINYVTMVFLLIVVTEFLRQYQRLNAAVMSIERRTLENVSLAKSTNEGRAYFDRVLRENIIHCIRHHQVLLQTFHQFETWFSIFFSVELAVSAIAFTFTLYVVLNAPSFGQILNYFSVVCLIWVNLLIRCLISEVFSHVNHDLSYTILWNAPWTEANKENTKLLVMFHSIACRPLRLFGLSIFEATRVTFAKLVRTTYSFLNVLTLSLKK